MDHEVENATIDIFILYFLRISASNVRRWKEKVQNSTEFWILDPYFIAPSDFGL